MTCLTDGLSEQVAPRAGPVFREGELLLRPSQVSQEQRYGDAVAFYRVHLSEEYQESLEFELSSDDLKVTGIYTDGLHTYSASERFEAIDLRCRAFDLMKTVKRLTALIKK